MNPLICRIDFIDTQDRIDNTNKFVLIYQDLNTQYCVLRPLTHICTKQVAHVLTNIFSTLGIPRILKCKGDEIFANQLFCHLYNQGINIVIIYKNLQTYNYKNPTEDTKIICEMINDWLTHNETNNWIEGLDMIQFQKNHNLYYEAIHLPISFNNLHSLNSKQGVTQTNSSTESICNVNTQSKNIKSAPRSHEEQIVEHSRKKTSIDNKAEIDLSLIIEHEEDNDKYEIIEEILNELEHQNQISSLMEIFDRERLQLLQETEDLPRLEQEVAQECSNLEGLQGNEKYSESNEEEEFLQLVQITTQECSNHEALQGNKNCSECTLADEEDLPQLVQEAAQECSNLEVFLLLRL